MTYGGRLTAIAHVLATCPVCVCGGSSYFLLRAFHPWFRQVTVVTSKRCVYLKPWRVSDVEISPKPMAAMEKRRHRCQECHVTKQTGMMWSQAKESLGLFGTHQKLEEARKAPLLDLLEPLSHIGFRPGSQTTQECIAVGIATQFGMLCSDCPINTAIVTIILTKCLSPVFTSLGTQKGVCFKPTSASFSGCYLSSHRMPLLLQFQSPLSHRLYATFDPESFRVI